MAYSWDLRGDTALGLNSYILYGLIISWNDITIYIYKLSYRSYSIYNLYVKGHRCTMIKNHYFW